MPTDKGVRLRNLPFCGEGSLVRPSRHRSRGDRVSALVAGKPALRASLADINSTRRINAVVLNGRYLVVPGSTSF